MEGLLLFKLYCSVATTSCLCTIALYYCIEKPIAKLKGSVRTHENNQRMYYVLCIKARSNVHAVTSFLFGIFSLIYGVDMYRDFVCGNSTLACVTCSITVGYMIGDLYIDILHWSEMGEVQYLIHHGFTIIAYGYVLVTGGLQMFAVVRVLSEGSTLFVNIRNVLHQSGLRTTPLYYYNCQAMLVTFTLFRVLTIPILLYMLLTVIRTDDFYMLDRLGKALPFAAHCVMDVLNIRWFCKILRSVRRMMST